jgi:hypothetical protein
MITSAAEFAALRTSQVQEEYCRAAHEEASVEIWLEVVRDYPDLREWVAHNKTVPVEMLELLHLDPSDRVRQTVASKRKLPLDLQQALSRDESPSVRLTLCHNARLDIAILATLCSDSEQFVREAALERYRQRTHQ